jgi:hypothetical protein
MSSAPGIPWTEAEPSRLQRDIAEVRAFDSTLTYIASDESLPHGGWKGTLPVWPFDRPAPEGLDVVVPSGLNVVLLYPAAYPMVPPIVYPIEPEPEPMEMTQSAWHVLPGGGLCLLQSDAGWTPEASITDLLLKAAGWRVEYALMKAGAIEQMSESGIVSDPTFDVLITAAARSEQ